MTESPQSAPKASGLQTVLNTIAAPKEAFQTLAVAPTWGWAAVIAIALLLIGGILTLPASQHATIGFTQDFVAHSRFAANMSDAQKQQMVDGALHPSAVKTALGLLFNAIVMPFIACVLNTLFLLLANAIGKGTAKFKNYFSSSWNVLIPSYGLAIFAGGLIALLRGPDSFNTLGDLFRVVPSLAYIAPAHGYAIGFLGAFSIFSIWGVFLNATSLKVMGNVKAGVAWTFAILILVLMAATLGLTTIFA